MSQAKKRPPVGNVNSSLVQVLRQGPEPHPVNLNKNAANKEKDEKPQPGQGKRPLEHSQQQRIARQELLEKGFGIQAVPKLPRLPSNDRHVASIIYNIQKYLTSTRVESIYMNIIQTLITLEEMPYNPYPLIVYALRTYMETLNVRKENKKAIDYSFNHPVDPTRIDYMFKSREVNFVWGLSNILRCCNAEQMSQYKWMMKDLIPVPETMVSKDEDIRNNYLVQAMVSLVGPSALHGTFYDDIPIVEVRCEYLIVGPNIEQAYELFLTCIVNDLNHMEKITPHIILGISVPVNPQAAPLKCVYRFWQVDEVQIRADDFWESSLAAVKLEKGVTAELIFKTDLFMLNYKRGKKIYSFNFLQTTENTIEVLFPYVETKFGALYEGVFFERSHCEAYLNMFTPRIELINLDKKRLLEPPPPREPNTIFQRFMRNDGIEYDPALNTIEPPVNSEEEFEDMIAMAKGGDLRTEKVRIPGFELTNPGKNNPEAPAIVNPLKEMWERLIARSHLYADVFDYLPYLIRVVLLERTKYPPDVLRQCWRLLHSKAYTLHLLIKQNQFIREIIENFEKAEESQIIQLQFKSYRKGLEDLLNSNIVHVSSEMETIGRVMKYRLMTITETDSGQGSNIKINPRSVLSLRFMNFLCLPVMWQLVEDVMITCPDVRRFVQKVKETYPDEVRQPEILMSKDTSYFFGFEDARIFNQDRLVLEVETAKERQLTIPEIATESVLMTYLLDTRIDEVWANFLEDLFSRTNLLPDPYPLLITANRRACLKMNMFFESDDEVLDRLYYSRPNLVDPENYIHHMPGCDAFGFQSALNAVDTAAIFRLSPLLDSLKNTTFRLEKDGYKAAIAMAITGNLPYYGRLDPYLCELNLVDHVYIKGPTSCSKEGSEYFASIVADHLAEMNQRVSSKFVIVGVFLGGRHKRWGLPQIVNDRTRSIFVGDVVKCISEKKQIYLKMLAISEWRYIPVIKYFRFHYVSYDETEYVSWFVQDPVETYLSVFMTRDEASFHAQLGGSHRCCNPFTGAAIRSAFSELDRRAYEAQRGEDWLEVHRCFLIKALIQRNNHHVAEAWRMLQSIAARLNFVNFLNKTLQDLVFYILEQRDFQTPSQPVTVATLANAPVYDEKKKKYFLPVEIPVVEIDEVFGNLDLSKLQSTLRGYYHRLYDLLIETASMTSDCMADVVRMQLNELLQRRPDGSVSLIIDSSTIRSLEDLRQETLSVIRGISYDVHVSCPEAVSAVGQVIKSASTSRPSEFEWDPIKMRHEAMKAPQMLIADHMDEWHKWL